MNGVDWREMLGKVKARAKAGDSAGAFAALCELADPWADFAVQARCAKLFRGISRKDLDLRPLRIAFLGGGTLDHFADVLAFWSAREGFAAEFYLADYDTAHQSVLDPASPLYAFAPDVAWLFTTERDVTLNTSPGALLEDIEADVAKAVESLTGLWDALQRNASCLIIQNTVDLPVTRVFGNYEATAPWSRLNLLRRFNLRLSEAARSGVTVFDLDYLASLFGKEHWYDPRYWYHSKHTFAMDAYGIVASRAARLLAAVKGQAKKCLVLDLDNTLWGGVIGDDGLEGIRLGYSADGEAFVDFQKYVLALKQRGIVLAVCSKNEEAAAKEPFEQHPDMQLRLDDIAVFKANWDNKADNIREIAETLNIGLDSIVFVDDNPAERALVRSMLPEVAVPEMPDDPADYVRALDAQAYFETVVFSEEDKVRGDLYRDNARRVEHQRSTTDLAAYLQSLAMKATVGTFDAFHLPRISQLINKSNQFHLTTTRYTEARIQAMMADPACVCRYFKLTDRFGDNGLIAALILRRDGDALGIDTWVMSCRVLSRGMEEFILGELVAIAREEGCARLHGVYIPTKKNGLVAKLYERLGFRLLEEDDGTTRWELDILQHSPECRTFIQRMAAES